MGADVRLACSFNDIELWNGAWIDPAHKTEAFKRVVVHETVEHLAWPDHEAKDMFHSNKVVNAPDVLPLKLLHNLLILLKPGRHDNGKFRMLKHGADLAKPPNSLFSRLITQE
ncbi:hypothetical protein [Roseinatronobacter sp.]|uniref:hypothetical protein n=1 Tax=Roseinatronobacter sp. TaxID=1945755 RepID=UPI0025D1E12B|nr:hypothetical protein [Rhodobaca sp.]